MKRKLTVKFLNKLKVPKVLIPGLIIASVLGWVGWKQLNNIKNYYQIKQIFPQNTEVKEVIDGDTFIIKNEMTLRLLGIDAPNKTQPNYEQAKDYLYLLTKNKVIKLEYDTYQDDKYGRLLAYVWIDCFEEIKNFCHEDKALVNELMIKKGLAEKVIYDKRKKLKYDNFLNYP